MARVCKSLTKPEQGYPHREHRSKGGRVVGLFYKKSQIEKKRRREKRKQFLEFRNGKLVKARKGKWIV